MTKEDMILEELQEMRKQISEMAIDLGVLKYRHNDGNKSEKVAVGIAALALLVSILVSVSSCIKEKKKPEVRNARKPSMYIPGAKHLSDRK